MKNKVYDIFPESSMFGIKYPIMQKVYVEDKLIAMHNPVFNSIIAVNTTALRL